MNHPEFTILMPCLNEEASIEFCMDEAAQYIRQSGICAEILIADNGSVDTSKQIALQKGARVIDVAQKGYGNALRAGIAAAEGKYIIMGDCDGSYDFSNLHPFVKHLRDGYALVMGNRFKGGIERGAMPFTHKYIGVPLLSLLGRLKYRVSIGDFHSGLRGFDREKALAFFLNAEGMEFATEMVGAFARAKEKICEVPIVLRCDKRSGKSHLRTIPDGLRHLRLIIRH